MTVLTTPQAKTRQTANGVRIECETRVDVPREFLWELIQEPSRRLEWDARVNECTLLTPRPLAKNGRVRISYSMLGWLDIDYTTYQPAARSAVKSTGRSRGNVIRSVVASWNFTPTTDGGTTWKTQIVIRAVGGRYLAPVVERVLVGPLMAWLTRISAGRLKRLAEREYRALAPAAAAA